MNNFASKKCIIQARKFLSAVFYEFDGMQERCLLLFCRTSRHVEIPATAKTKKHNGREINLKRTSSLKPGEPTPCCDK